MRFLYKIHAGYDGFTPKRLPDRMLEGGVLELGWAKYLDVLNLGDEVWVYFHGRSGFQRGIYAIGRVSRIDLDGGRAYLRVTSSSTSTPLTDDAATELVAATVATRYRRVFLFPEALKSTDTCTVATDAETCKQRLCEGCPTWQALEGLDPQAARPPERLIEPVASVVSGYWAIPARAWRVSEIRLQIRETSDLFYAFKAGEENLAFPLALAIRTALITEGVGEIDGIVPVPLSPEKEARGELNRTRVLADELGLLLSAPVHPIISLRSPISKGALKTSAPDFERQYASEVVVDISVPSLRRVLVVDDVCTHGSTLGVVVSSIRAAHPGVEVIASSAFRMVLKAAVREHGAVWTAT